MKLRKNLVQGIEALMLAMLCYWTNADGAAVIMLAIGVVLLFGKKKSHLIRRQRLISYQETNQSHYL
jgi:hypothetical protein